MKPYSFFTTIKRLSLLAFLILASLAQGARETGKKKESPKLPPAPDGVVIEQNIPYLPPGRVETLDLYTPAARAKEVRSPAVVIIHGGGWTGGDKAALREFVSGTTLAQAGYVCVSVEYWKVRANPWPTNIQDCKNAVRWLRANAARLQVDPERIGVIGGSAGGHLALMVAYTPGLAELEPKEPYPGVSDRVSACVDLYGITDLLTRQSTTADGTPNGKLRGTVFFPESREKAPEKWRLASPVTHITKNSPPTLIIHGTKDTTVDREQSAELVRKLTAAGVENRLITVPGATHAFAIKTKEFDLRPEVLAFFDRHLKAPAPAAPR